MMKEIIRHFEGKNSLKFTNKALIAGLVEILKYFFTRLPDISLARKYNFETTYKQELQRRKKKLKSSNKSLLKTIVLVKKPEKHEKKFFPRDLLDAHLLPIHTFETKRGRFLMSLYFCTEYKAIVIMYIAEAVAVEKYTFETADNFTAMARYILKQYKILKPHYVLEVKGKKSQPKGPTTGKEFSRIILVRFVAAVERKAKSIAISLEGAQNELDLVSGTLRKFN